MTDHTSSVDPGAIHGQRVRKDKGYESLRRRALQDPRLSFKATGILAYLLSLPDKWRTDAERLSKAKNGQGRAKEGRESIQAGLRELEDVGYLTRRKYQDERGRWRWIWQYSDDPGDLQEHNVSAGRTVNGLPGDGSSGDGSPGDIEVLEVEVLEVEVLEVENLKPSSEQALRDSPPQAEAAIADLASQNLNGQQKIKTSQEERRPRPRRPRRSPALQVPEPPPGLDAEELYDWIGEQVDGLVGNEENAADQMFRRGEPPRKIVYTILKQREVGYA